MNKTRTLRIHYKKNKLNTGPDFETAQKLYLLVCQLTLISFYAVLVNISSNFYQFPFIFFFSHKNSKML
jgi:hypothetical protein